MAKDYSFNEQAYLMWEHYVHKRKGSPNKTMSQLASSKEKSGMSFHKVIGNYQPGDFISKLISCGNKFERYQNILDLETHKISSLIPEIKLFRISGNKYIPFYFPEAAEKITMASMLTPGSSMGAIGIRSFDFKFVGKDFFTRDKQIECSLSIYTDSMENIFKEPPAGFAQLNELFTISSGQGGVRGQIRQGFSKEVSSEKINRPFSHEIGAFIGYTVPDKDSVFTSQERQALQNTSSLLRLTYTGHNISVSQDGQTSIDITYIGRLDGALSDSMYNILADPIEIIEISKIQSDIDYFKENSDPNSTATKEKIAKLNAKLKAESRERLQRIIRLLQEEKKIRSVRANPKAMEEYHNFVKQLSSTEKSSVKKESSGKPAPKKDKSKKTEESISNNDAYIQYVYIADFIQATVKSIVRARKASLTLIDKSNKSPKQKEAEKKVINKALEGLTNYKMLFGNTPIYTGRDQATIANLADIPISMKTIAQFLFETVIQTGASKFVLSEFIDKVVGRLYPQCLNDHLYKDARNMHDVINIRSITLSGPDSKALGEGSDKVDIEDLPDFLKKKNINREFDQDKEHYFIYSDMATRESVARRGDRKEDMKSGVYHFNMSKDRGMLKSIDFSQATVQYRKEALMLESVSLFDELKMPYNVSITMCGNGLFMPGSMIYVNPSSIGFGDPRNPRSAAARLGIGGYYIVISVNTTYNNGALVTTLDARHQDWASQSSALTTLEEMDQLGITAKSKRIVDRGESSWTKNWFD